MPRRLAALTVFAVLAVGCAQVKQTISPQPVSPGSSAAAGEAAASQSSGRAPAALSPAPANGSASGPPAPAPGSLAASGDNPDVGGPGDLARGFLRPSPYAEISVEIDTAGDAAPPSSVVSRLTDVLGRVTGKPVHRAGGNTLPGKGSGCWSDSEIRSAAATRRHVHTSGSTVTLYVLYLDGTSCEDKGVLGEAFEPSAMAVFADAAGSAALPTVGSARYVEAVTVHELGHILGLVNIGYHSPTAHEDAAHPHHSANRDSVMYWAIDQSDLIQTLLTGPPVDFDSDDLADLAGLRSGSL